MSKKLKVFTGLFLFLLICLAGCGSLSPSAQETFGKVSGNTGDTSVIAEDLSDPGDTGQYSEGEYQVSVRLEGGSGKAAVSSPTSLAFKDGEWTLKLLWSSSNYDYMIVDGERYFPISTEGGSLFEIKLRKPAGEIPIIADTTAMSTPHEIEYTLVLGPVDEDDEGSDQTQGDNTSALQDDAEKASGISDAVIAWSSEHEPASSLELKYAEGFCADLYEDGSALVLVYQSGDAFFLLPEGAYLPSDLPDEITVLKVPLEKIYLSTSGTMDMFRAMAALDAVRFTSTNVFGWDMTEVIEAMNEGRILYVGSYSAPDYERLLAEGCSLAVENTMIYHAPEAEEQLERLGIPVLVDFTSYENEPLGRCEWIKLYGLLTGREDEAKAAFDEQEALFLDAASGGPTGKTVAFFYINQSGLVNVRRSYDYLARMIGMAGGEYIFPDLGSPEANSPTISMQMEEFYAGAKDADILIYNGSMEGEIYTVGELTAMSPLFAKFRAVENGNVFCARKSMYQASMEMGTILSDFRAMITGEDDKLIYFYRLK